LLCGDAVRGHCEGSMYSGVNLADHAIEAIALRGIYEAEG
jgi:predicted NAD/FAD-dependent oxidoreductase